MENILEIVSVAEKRSWHMRNKVSATPIFGSINKNVFWLILCTKIMFKQLRQIYKQFGIRIIV